jgi:hypothetical protein
VVTGSRSATPRRESVPSEGSRIESKRASFMLRVMSNR